MMRRTVLGTVGLVFTQMLCSSCANVGDSQRLSRTTGASSTLIRSACRLISMPGHLLYLTKLRHKWTQMPHH